MREGREREKGREREGGRRERGEGVGGRERKEEYTKRIMYT